MKKFLFTFLLSVLAVFCFAGERLHQIENYENGNVKYKIISVDNGFYYKYFQYYESGEIQMTGFYNDMGIKCWAWTTFYKNGINESVKNYYSGVAEGSWFFYGENGNLLMAQNYKSGKKHGAWILYNDNGQKIFHAEYKKGKKHGEFYKYDDYGKLIVTENYKRGKLIDGWSWDEDKGLVARYP